MDARRADAYNPYGHGSERARSRTRRSPASASPSRTYLRQAQRYLAHAVRALDGGRRDADAGASLLELMDPRRLELLARRVPSEHHARRLFAYLDSLDARQRAGLSGTRDRLAILAESELGRWLHPTAGVPVLDLPAAVRSGAVSYFCLEADRLPLLSRMLAAAIVGDLLTIAATCQAAPAPTLVAIDEFSAIAPDGVARLFGRARAAGFNLLLATQELADLRAAAPELLEQVLGNVETVIAHRQSVPDSAELIARIAGTRPAWSSTEQLAQRGPHRAQHAEPLARVRDPPRRDPHARVRHRRGQRGQRGALRGRADLSSLTTRGAATMTQNDRSTSRSWPGSRRSAPAAPTSSPPHADLSSAAASAAARCRAPRARPAASACSTVRPALHVLTRRGLRAAGRPELDPVVVGASGFAHLLAVARRRCRSRQREHRRDRRRARAAGARARRGQAPRERGGRLRRGRLGCLHRPGPRLLAERPAGRGRGRADRQGADPAADDRARLGSQPARRRRGLLRAAARRGRGGGAQRAGGRARRARAARGRRPADGCPARTGRRVPSQAPRSVAVRIEPTTARRP